MTPMTITAWADAPAGAHATLGPYLDAAWLPIIGPTSTAALRHLAGLVDDGPTTVDPADIAHAIGVGHRTGRNAPLAVALQRLNRFGLIQLDPHQINVRVLLPRLSAHQLDRLPPAVARRALDTHNALTGTGK